MTALKRFWLPRILVDMSPESIYVKHAFTVRNLEVLHVHFSVHQGKIYFLFKSLAGTNICGGFWGRDMVFKTWMAIEKIKKKVVNILGFSKQCKIQLVGSRDHIVMRPQDWYNVFAYMWKPVFSQKPLPDDFDPYIGPIV